MATKTIRANIQVGANNPAQNKPVDRNLLSYVKAKADNRGWSVADTDKFVKSGVLNDAPRGSKDEYGNVTEGNVIRPMMAKARDMRKKVELDGTRFEFSSASSRDHFVSEMGRWFSKNAKPDAKVAKAPAKDTVAQS